VFRAKTFRFTNVAEGRLFATGSSAPSSLPEVIAWRFVTDDSQIVADNGDTGLNLADY